MMKRGVIRFLLGLTVIALIGVLLFSFFSMKGAARYVIQPNRTRVVVKNSGDQEFLSKEDVLRVLPIDTTDTTVMAVNLSAVEKEIRAEIPYAKEVNAYISPTFHQMTVQVQSRRPLLRYYNSQGSFYLDDEGHPMRTKSGVSAYLPVVKVNQVDSVTLHDVLFPLALFLEEHEEWSTFFSMIELTDENRLHFYPRVGDYVFQVLGTANLENDLKKIPIFYNKIVPQVGANRYRLVKLSYEGQIVCKKRG
ncbi:MAG: hypothetical protein Q4E10_02190 [Porphyromonas sp.]|nr:hypothetical protein [Porphyromonas sp.]